ncbi:hypothetical protein [Lacibacter cauensis]|nr:hypothetical protein [Lacibacter cauensis]
MGKSLTIGGKTFVAKKPSDNRLRVFNSFKELMANADNDAKAKYIDIVKNPELEIRFQPSTVNDLMKTSDINKYLQSMQFNVEVFHNNTRYVTRYKPNEMFAFVTFTSDKKVADKYQQVANLEKELKSFTEQAQKNAKLIYDAQKKNLSASQKQKLQEAVVTHNYTVQDFAKKLPKEIQLQVRTLNIQQLSEVVNIGVIPVIVWVVLAIVGTGATLYTATKITQLITDTVKHRNLLLSQQKNIETLLKAEELYAGGKITKEGRDNVANEVKKSNEQARTEQQNIDNRSNAGFFGEIKSVIMWAGIAVVAAKVLPSLFSNNKGGSK